jgi:DNA-binding response OmpR family regulator
MNEPPLDKTESVIDIFVLSISESLAPQLTEHLEDKGYRVTIFSDSKRLLETLGEGKPNLLICDTTTIEDGFEVCRRIKADADLWVIPVLIFTSASTLADFLNVLDCNADNFLAYPSDLPYRLSLIDSMLTTPVERQTPDLIKTQFKINHEDRIYVVAASRRKILEFLLSSFEIAVNKSSDLSELKREVQRLTELAETLEESVTEHTCVIDLLNASVKQKEQKIAALTIDGAEKARTIVQKTEEIRRQAAELDAEKALVATGNDKIRLMIREKEEIESFHSSEIDALRQQVAGLLTQIGTAQTRLTSVQHEYEEEKTHVLSLEGTLQQIAAQKDLAEKSLQTLSAEHEQLKSDFGASMDRAVSAEQKIQVILQEKEQAEQDLTGKITGLDQTLHQRNVDLTALGEELEREKNGRVSGEELARSLTQEKEHLELSLQSVISELRGQLNALQEKYTSAASGLENRESTIQTLEKNLEESVADKERTEEEVRTNQVLYDTTLAQMNHALSEASGIRSALETDLTAAKKQNQDYMEALTQSTRDNEQSGQRVTSLTGELDQAKEALGIKESQIASLRGNLADAILEKENTEARVKTDLESYKTTFIRLKRDLDETLASRRALEKDLASAKTQSKAYAEELALATRNKEQSGQKIRMLADDLERVKADLDTERSLHQTSAENLKAIELARRGFEQDLMTSADEQKFLNAQLESERKLRLLAEEKSNAAAQEEKRLKEELRAVAEEHGHQEQDRALKIQTLKKDLETVCDLQKSLEEEVSILNKEKVKAEQKVQALTSELEQARSALADEWVDHMTSDEQLAAAVLERQRLQQSLSQQEPSDTGKEKVQAIIAKEPDLPVRIDPSSHSLELVAGSEEQPSPVSEYQESSSEPSTGPVGETSETVLRSMNFSEIEDLFEEDEPLSPPEKDTGLTEAGNKENLSPVPEAPGTEKEEPGDDDGYDETEPEEESEEEPGEEPGQGPGVPDESGRAIPLSAFSFNRRQWLSLFKWARHSESLSHDQRLQIIRMGRLIQKNRRLTQEQEDQVQEMIALVQALGYRPA